LQEQAVLTPGTNKPLMIPSHSWCGAGRIGV
jgi:hypothetical protein